MKPSRREWSIWFGVAALVVATRLMTSVHYIADPDSLRFALGLIDFDLTSLQPHFPGYPVFIGLARLVALAGLPMGTTFALVGSIATLVLIAGFLGLNRTRIASREGILATFLITFSPMIWLMANRYMPDLLGAAVALAAVVLLVRDDYRSREGLLLGIGLVGLLCGIRLSYAPLLLLPFIVGFIRIDRKITAAVVFTLGLLVWFVPMVLDTGFEGLVDAARAQTTGHFTDFGGTIETTPGLDDRRVAVIEAIVADGLGGYWSGRHPVTLPALIGLVVLFARGVWEIFFREPEGLLIVVLSMAVYLGWILLYQNVIYQPRHVLPLLPILLSPVWAGGVTLMKSTAVGRLVVVATLASLALSSIVPALQQREPTAIARVADYLRPMSDTSRTIRSTPLVCWFLATNGVTGTCDTADIADLTAARGSEPSSRPDFVVGWLLSTEEIGYYRRRTFHHNPYVNSIWPELPVYTRLETDGDGR